MPLNSVCLNETFKCACKKGYEVHPFFPNIETIGYKQDICYISNGEKCDEYLLFNNVGYHDRFTNSISNMSRLQLEIDLYLDQLAKDCLVPNNDCRNERSYLEKFTELEELRTFNIVAWQLVGTDNEGPQKALERWSCASGKCENGICVPNDPNFTLTLDNLWGPSPTKFFPPDKEGSAHRNSPSIPLTFFIFAHISSVFISFNLI